MADTDDGSARRQNTVTVRLFVDFWNFQLGLIAKAGREFRPDWYALAGRIVARVKGIQNLDPAANYTMEEMRVYISINPKSPKDLKLKGFATTVLNRVPGIFVNLVERRYKGPPKCPACYQEIDTCPKCQQGTSGTIEKGVDTMIVTDMIRLAWSSASYDIGVLISDDRDFIPAAEFLQSRGVKIIQAGFGNGGRELATKCWASIDLSQNIASLSR